MLEVLASIPTHLLFNISVLVVVLSYRLMCGPRGAGAVMVLKIKERQASWIPRQSHCHLTDFTNRPRSHITEILLDVGRAQRVEVRGVRVRGRLKVCEVCGRSVVEEAVVMWIHFGVLE